jgi:hypothetical protein
MNIHLIRDREVDALLYADVLDLLRRAPGSMNFLPGEDVAILERRIAEMEVEEIAKLEEKFEDIKVDRQEPPPMPSYSIGPMSRIERVPAPDLWKIVFSWKDLFKICNDYRNRNSLPKSDFVILLTGYSNELNWFGSAEEQTNNFFIQTTQWSRYLDGNVEATLPLAYEVAVWILRKLMFDTWKDGEAYLHHQSIGCMNDFCRNKQEISLKIRTGDVCPACLAQLQRRDVNPTILRQAFHIMDHVRSSLTWKHRADFLKQPSRLEIRGPLMKLYLLDSGGLEVRLNPLQRALYLLILERSEGLNLNYLDTESEKLMDFYARFATQGNEDAHRKTINSLCDLQDNARNITLSRIKRKFIEAVGEKLSRHYIPQKKGDGVYRIHLDREFVVRN